MELNMFGVDSTGYTGEPCRAMKVPYDRFEVTIQLGPNDEFLGILNVSVKKDFLTTEQRVNSIGYLDVADLYEIEQP